MLAQHTAALVVLSVGTMDVLPPATAIHRGPTATAGRARDPAMMLVPLPRAGCVQRQLLLIGRLTFRSIVASVRRVLLICCATSFCVYDLSIACFHS